MHLKRHEVANLLQEQATSLDVRILETGYNYTYTLDIDGKQYHACTLSLSSEYYTYRLNLTNDTITLLVAGMHNTCVKLPVLALDDGYLYAPAEQPRWYDPAKRHSQKDCMVIVGGLLSGVEEMWEYLNSMEPRNKYRYRARMRTYLNQRPGGQLQV